MTCGSDGLLAGFKALPQMHEGLLGFSASLPTETCSHIETVVSRCCGLGVGGEVKAEELQGLSFCTLTVGLLEGNLCVGASSGGVDPIVPILKAAGS